MILCLLTAEYGREGHRGDIEWKSGMYGRYGRWVGFHVGSPAATEVLHFYLLLCSSLDVCFPPRGILAELLHGSLKRAAGLVQSPLFPSFEGMWQTQRTAYLQDMILKTRLCNLQRLRAVPF